MRKIVILALANIRKSKGHTISLGIMLVIAAMMLSLGLLMSLNYNSYFDKTADELQTSNCYISIPLKYYNDDVSAFIENHSNVKQTASEYAIPYGVNVKNAENKNVTRTMLFFNNSAERQLTRKKFIGEVLPLDDNSVYVGYYFYIEWGYQLGDTITIKQPDGEKEYQIQGFIEDIYYASPDLGIMSMYFSDKEFNRIFENTEDTCIIFYTNLQEDIAAVETDLYEYIANQYPEIQNDNNLGNSIWCIHLPVCKLSRTMMASMLAVMMVALSVIVVIICMIVIRFRIKNTIEEDMVKIGSLKAIGYTSKQIITSIIMQFLIISSIGSAIGIAASYLALPAISDVLSHQSALKWTQGFDLKCSIVTLFAILFFVVLISLSTARKIKKLNPIIALRSGIQTHSFKKNHLPLDQTKGALSFVIGMKLIFQNVKQSMMILMITLSVSFVGVFGLIMYYNTTFDTTAFAETPGSEVTNISLKINPMVTDNQTFLNEVLQRDGIAFAQYITPYTTTTIDGLTISNTVMEDYSQRRTQTIYEGRYPLHDNEIAMNGIAAKLMGKTIGDTVLIKGQASDEEYLITGLQQGANFGGMNSSMTYEGYLRLYPDFQFDNLVIYLDEDVDTAEYLESLLTDYGDVIVKSWNEDKEFAEGMGMYTDIVSKVGIAVLFVALMIIILVLYFVLNSLVIRQRHALGIQKALGFTTIQLMNQMTCSVMPSIILGIAAGSTLGALMGNPIMSVVQRGMGIMKAHYVVMPDWVIIFSILIAVLSYLSSMLITAKIHRISAYALFTE